MVVGRGREDRGKKESEGDAVRSDWHEWGATAVCDGACEPNPGGRMFWSVAIVDAGGDVIDSHRGEPSMGYDGPRTNNVAEYLAATLAAKILAEYDGPRRILTDSAVVLSGVRSRRSPTPHLQALLVDLLQLLDAHRIAVEWTPRDLPVALLGH